MLSVGRRKAGGKIVRRKNRKKIFKNLMKKVYAFLKFVI